MNRHSLQRGLVRWLALAAVIVIAVEIVTGGLTAWRSSDSPPANWLREADQEQLADALTTASARYPWVAGCLWASGTGADRTEAVSQLGFAPDDGWTMISARHLKSGALMLLLTHTGPRTTRGFDERSGKGFF